MILRQAGIRSGVAPAYAAARMIESLLAGLQPVDLVAFAASVALAAMTVAGSFLPALRAVRVDPIQAIRS